MSRIEPNITLRGLLSLGLEGDRAITQEDLKEVTEDYEHIIDLAKLFLFSRYPLRRLLAKRDLICMLNSLTLSGAIVISEGEYKDVYLDDETYQVRIHIGRYPKELILEEPVPSSREKERWLSD